MMAPYYLVFEALVWIKCHVQFVLFTTKITKDTKGSDNPIPNFVLFVSFVVKTLSHLIAALPR